MLRRESDEMRVHYQVGFRQDRHPGEQHHLGCREDPLDLQVGCRVLLGAGVVREQQEVGVDEDQR